METCRDRLRSWLLVGTLVGACWTLTGATSPSHWKSFPIDGGGYVQNVVFTRNPQVAYLTVDVGGPYRTDDGGQTWRPLHGGFSYAMRLRQLDHPRSLSVDPRDENSLVCAAGNDPRSMGGLVVSRDGGRTWRLTATGNYLSNGRRRWMGQLLSRNPWNPDELVTGGDCTGLMKSVDNGETWREIGLKDHWFSHIHHDLAVKGRVWACAPGYEDVPEEARDQAAGKDPNPRPRYGRLRGLYRSEDGGETWNRLEMARVPEELGQIAGEDRIVGVFEEQTVRETRDGGRTWTDCSQGLSRLPPNGKVWENYGCQRGRYKGIGAGPDFFVICDTRGNVFRRGADESRWTEIPHGPVVYTHPKRELRPYKNMPAACTIVVDPHDANHWMITDWYAAWETNDAGNSWHSRIHGAQPLVPFTIAASPFDSNVVFYATADSRMYISRDGTKTFGKVVGEGAVGESVNSIAFSRVTPGLALVTGGKFNPCVRITRDNGATWSLCATNGLPAIRPDLGWTKKDGFYAPYSIAVHPLRDEFYIAMGGVVGFGKGGIYRTRDAGTSWEWFGDGLPAGANLFKFMEWGNGEALAVSASGDMMCWSMDGSQVFRRGSQDAAWSRVEFSLKAVDAASGRSVQASVKAVPGKPGWFLSTSGQGMGALFRSTDGGRTFSRLGDRSGAFAPLAFDLHAPGMLLAAAGDDVWISRDFGENFSVLPDGMSFPASLEPNFHIDRGRIWAMGSGNGAWTY